MFYKIIQYKNVLLKFKIFFKGIVNAERFVFVSNITYAKRFYSACD